jgi:ribonuclease P protein component
VEDSLKRSRDETHVSAIQDPARANARLPRADEDGRRAQGPVRAPGQGPRTPVRLTHVPTSSPARRTAVYRLRGAGAFEAVFRLGARHDAHFLQLIAAPAAQSPGRVGYVIGRKSMRRAVDRNRLRRRLRESVRAARPAIEAYDVILRVKRAVLRGDIAAANAESRRLLAQIVRALPQ